MPDPLSQTAFDLANHPGFLIRRLHQIHVALFIQECASFDVTPVRYSIMSVVQSHPGLDQARLGEEVRADRATLANVVGYPEARGLLQRRTSPTDRRLRLIEMMDEGAALLEQMDAPARRAHARTVATMPRIDRRAFTHALASLVEAGNGHGRAALGLGRMG
jgi:DNA-binding MarR family transcriptional regulator